MINNKGKTEALYKELIRKKTGQERMMMGFLMLDLSKKMVVSSLKDNTVPDDIKKAVFIRFYKNDFSKGQLKDILRYIS